MRTILLFSNMVLFFQICVLQILFLEKSDKIPNRKKPSLQHSNSTWNNINIIPDYSLLNANITIKTFVQKIVDKSIIPRLQNLIKVQKSEDIPSFSEVFCPSLSVVPSIYSDRTTSADLLIIFQLVSDSASPFLASACACLLDRETNRPNVGVVSINIAQLLIQKSHVDLLVKTIFHECFHILVMSSSLFNRFPNKSHRIINKVTPLSPNATVIQINSPKVLKVARKYFDCSTLEGIDLEDQGSSTSLNSHWEKSFLGNELMTSQMTGKPVLSAFTLALMEDSGWYKVDFSLGQSLIWGKNKGCGFLNTICQTTFSEFCTQKSELSCSKDYTSKLYCLTSDFSGGCSIREYSSGMVCNSIGKNTVTSISESFGVNSRCFDVKVGDQSTVGCYKATCLANGISIEIGENKVLCKTTDQKIMIAGVELKCPDQSTFCDSFQHSCTDDCGGHGDCLLSGKCWCHYFYTGEFCSQFVECDLGPEICNASLESDQDTNITKMLVTSRNGIYQNTSVGIVQTQINQTSAQPYDFFSGILSIFKKVTICACFSIFSLGMYFL